MEDIWKDSLASRFTVKCPKCGSDLRIMPQMVEWGMSYAAKCYGCGEFYLTEKPITSPVEGDNVLEKLISEYFDSHKDEHESSEEQRRKASNYLELANAALEMNDLDRIEGYCDKAIAEDPNCAFAWYLKGHSIGWNGKLGDDSDKQAMFCFKKALTVVDEKDRLDLSKKIKSDIEEMMKVTLSMRVENFKDEPSKEQANAFKSETLRLLLNYELDSCHMGIRLDTSFKEDIAIQIDNAVLDVYRKVRSIMDENNGHPSTDALLAFIEYSDNCISIFEEAINLFDGDDERDIQRYDIMVKMQESMINAWSYEYEVVNGRGVWSKDRCLSDSAKDGRRKLIRDYKAKRGELQACIDKKKAEEAQKRFDEYWASHADQKKELEEEKAKKKEELSAREEELKNLPFVGEIKEIEVEIDSLNKARKSLGLFKGKEKKEIDGKIKPLEEKKAGLVVAQGKKKGEIESQIKALKNRISEIDRELTKPR